MCAVIKKGEAVRHQRWSSPTFLYGPAVATVMSTGLPDVQAPQNPTAQFSLSSSFPPLPAKLVSKIRSLQYIDMKELLPDNIGLARSRGCLRAGGTTHASPGYPAKTQTNSIMGVRLCCLCSSPFRVTPTPCPVTLSLYVSNYSGS